MRRGLDGRGAPGLGEPLDEPRDLLGGEVVHERVDVRLRLAQLCGSGDELVRVGCVGDQGYFKFGLHFRLPP